MDTRVRSFDEYVNMSYQTGVEPLELKFYPVVDIEEGLPIAYRTKMVIHSVILGDLEEDNYVEVSDSHNCSKELFKRMIMHAIRAYKAFVKKERNIEFISIRCPSSLVNKVSLFDLVSEVLNEYKWFDPSKLCLEFPQSLLKENYDKAKMAILDMKLLHVKTAILGVGCNDFEVSKLSTITPSIVFMDSAATCYAGSRNKPQMIPSLVQYIKSMGIQTIAEGIEIYRKLLRNTDCIGFYDINCKELDLDEAVAQKEDLYE